MKSRIIRNLHLSWFVICLVLGTSFVQAQSYDAGPDPLTPMGKELIDIVASQPYMPGISDELLGEQKFRPAFGPTLWRMLTKPNSIKILFIGQDGTHIAEAAGRTATAGFGGRAQDLAAFFGVSTSAAFINTFAFTIKGQYGSFETPIVTSKASGPDVDFSGFVDNGLWLMSQDLSSPMVKWRNQIIDWIIRNNRDSLKLVVVFGGAARDSIASFIESRGGKVATRYAAEDLKQIKVPLIDLKSAGGNNEFPVVLDKEGHDLYEILLGRKLDYSNLADQKAATTALKEHLNSVLDKMALTNGGISGSGILHPGQLGGYDLRKITIDTKQGISLKGLKLTDGTQISQDVLVAAFPHPSALSKMQKAEASKAVGMSLRLLQPYVNQGWKINEDSSVESKFSKGENYSYSRTDIPESYYDFGTPQNRMVPVSDASRMPGRSNVIVLGTREAVKFDANQILNGTKAQPGSSILNSEMFIARPRSLENRYVFDSGPGEYLAKLMKGNLNLAIIGKEKPGMTFKKDGIDAYNVKTHPLAVGDFGHYRGTFKSPQVVILADPDGYDDLITSRALTGSRGQYLQSLLESAGFPEEYLIIKTVPFGMEGASNIEWTAVLNETSEYRNTLFAEVFKNSRPQLIIADGKFAQAEIQRLLPLNSQLPVVNISRQGSENNYDLENAAKKLEAILGRPVEYQGRMANIPRSHLPFFSRVWEGTSGSRVFNAIDQNKGLAFAEVAPEWAFKQKIDLGIHQKYIETQKERLTQNGLIIPGKKVDEFFSEGFMPRPAAGICRSALVR